MVKIQKKYNDEEIIYWKEILLLMYQLDINKLTFDKSRNLLEKNHKYELLKSKLPDDAKIDVAVSKLIDLKYLKRLNKDKLDSFIIKDGIEIALKSQENLNSQRRDSLLVYLTVILAMGAIAETSQIISFGVNWIACLAFVILFIALIFFGIKKLSK